MNSFVLILCRCLCWNFVDVCAETSQMSILESVNVSFWNFADICAGTLQMSVLELCRYLSLQQLQSKCDDQRCEIEQLTARVQELTESTENQLLELQRYQKVEDDNKALMEELAFAEQTNQELRFQMSKLEHNLGESGMNQQEELLSTLRARLKKVHAERADALDKADKCQAGNDDLCAEIEGLRKALSDSERMREEMKAQIETLMREMAALMHRKPHAEIDSQNFKDFVHVKRELANVKQENESLRMQLRPVREGALPKLSGSGSLTSSRSSARNGKKTTGRADGLLRRW